MTTHLPHREQRLLTIEEQSDQAYRCACRGADDYCPCQNMADYTTLRRWVGHNVAARLEYALGAGR